MLLERSIQFENVVSLENAIKIFCTNKIQAFDEFS